MCILFSGYVIFKIWKKKLLNYNYRILLIWITESYCFFYWILLIFLPKITALFTEIYCYFYRFLLKIFTENYWIFYRKLLYLYRFLPYRNLLLLNYFFYHLPSITVTEFFGKSFTDPPLRDAYQSWIEVIQPKSWIWLILVYRLIFLFNLLEIR